MKHYWFDYLISEQFRCLTSWQWASLSPRSQLTGATSAAPPSPSSKSSSPHRDTKTTGEQGTQRDGMEANGRTLCTDGSVPRGRGGVKRDRGMEGNGNLSAWMTHLCREGTQKGVGTMRVRRHRGTVANERHLCIGDSWAKRGHRWLGGISALMVPLC